MSTFDEHAHPRQPTGKFAHKRGDAPAGELTEPTIHGRPMNPKRVTIDGAITVDAADVSPDIRWNGWAVPVFDRENTDKIIEWVNGQDDGTPGPVLEWVDGKLIDVYYYDDGTTERDEIEPVYDSAGTPLYGVGAFSWVWSEVEDTDED